MFSCTSAVTAPPTELILSQFYIYIYIRHLFAIKIININMNFHDTVAPLIYNPDKRPKYIDVRNNYLCFMEIYRNQTDYTITVLFIYVETHI
jgi:hypothetical protein